MLETRKFGADTIHIGQSKGRYQDATHNSYWRERISKSRKVLGASHYQANYSYNRVKPEFMAESQKRWKTSLGITTEQQ